MNKICVHFDEYGYIPVNDTKYTFITPHPIRIGDDAIIKDANGVRRNVRLLKSKGHVKDGTYLVCVK